MDYFSILNLNKEPFSNSPDPEYFFSSQQHQSCLQKLELSIRLRRGLNVVIGDVGTGKTTLCRQLIRRFADDQDCETHLILDPSFAIPSDFLATVAALLAGERPPADTNEWQVKELIKQTIFHKGVDKKKIIVLIIDEGQKIPEFCLEILREFLNFETNEHKLLQIVIFAQKEFERILDIHANLADRINLVHILAPLDFRDTRHMIQFRIDQSSSVSNRKSFFTYPALWKIYRMTRGYPRKIVNLCHRIILAMIIQNRTRAGWFLVRSCARRAGHEPMIRWRRVLIPVLIVLVMTSVAIGLTPVRFSLPLKWRSEPANAPEDLNKSFQAPIASKPNGSDTRVDIPQSPPSPQRRKDENLDRSARLHSGLVLQTEAVQEMSKSLPVSTGENKELPLMLGQVALKHNETMWWLIKKVYGIYNSRYIEAMEQANPDIKDPKRIVVGRLISIPAIPVKIKPHKTDIFWVKLGDKDQLNEAIEDLRTYPEDAPSIRLIPYWNKNELKFAILLRELFFNEINAAKQIEKLPAETTAKAIVLSSWDKDVVFFSDPYAVPR